MTKRRKIIIFFVLVLAIIFIVCPLLWLYTSTKPYTKVIWKNWQIELPSEGARDLYSYSEPSFHGDGIRYHVIDYEIGNESKRVQNSVFQLEKIFLHASQPTDGQIAYVEHLLNETSIQEDVFPDWGNCQLVYEKKDDYSEIFMFYWSGTGTLYVVESFF